MTIPTTSAQIAAYLESLDVEIPEPPEPWEPAEQRAPALTHLRRPLRRAGQILRGVVG